ncbi:TIGR01548 family HAD-type hydrolase [Prochlorococcus sp. MIT 1300]|uniref:TIGR01548 family HAD-type hydrolase n=1 Tax=Prochlorococcus sp. MIT 1300 TaxID=3096218 RepID=UPI002A75424A|nr:TIGR01548 family HAD-type hydrolase [Prochlorococcus sp. MIT 1300]
MKGLLLFDIDGVIRDVSKSYRLAIQRTVNHFCGWEPALKEIDSLKAEGSWNNDWDCSLELIKRFQDAQNLSLNPPSRSHLIEIFSGFYFGGDPFTADRTEWKGFIRNEPLLVEKDFFEALSLKQITWGFVSGAEPESARFVLEDRIGLKNPPLIAMGDAPDKPNPQGFLQLANSLGKGQLGANFPPIGYLGDTVADVLTIKEARKKLPGQTFISLAIAPPHLQGVQHQNTRKEYENKLIKSGAERILCKTTDAIHFPFI